jgi:hypothetical protein
MMFTGSPSRTSGYTDAHDEEEDVEDSSAGCSRFIVS